MGKIFACLLEALLRCRLVTGEKVRGGPEGGENTRRHQAHPTPPSPKPHHQMHQNPPQSVISPGLSEIPPWPKPQAHPYSPNHQNVLFQYDVWSP